MRIIVILCLFFIQFNAFAQPKDPKVKFGKVNPDDVSWTSYKEDPNAPAVVLYNKGNVYYLYSDQVGWTQVYEVHTRIKIFKKEAYRYANISFPYWSKANITDLKGITYNTENGKVIETKLNGENIFTEEISKKRSVKKITMPAVKEGSIIEFKYTINTVNAASLPIWYFQDLIPTLWSEFSAEVPDIISYRKMSQGHTPFAITDEGTSSGNFSVMYRIQEDDKSNASSMHNIKVNYKKNTMRYVQTNVYSLKVEPLVNSPYDYLSRIAFEINAIYNSDYVPSSSGEYTIVKTSQRETSNSWQDLGKEIYTDVYDDYINANRWLDDAVVQRMATEKNAKNKVTILMDFFTKTFQVKEQDYIYPSQPIKDLVTNHKGTPTDLNLLFIAYLRKVGLEASPVLISTRYNGRIIQFYPNLFSMNRTIVSVKLEDKDYLLDAANTNLPLGLLPYEDTNGEGLLLKSKTEQNWVELTNKVNTRTALSATLSIASDAQIDGNLAISTSGYDANTQRVIYKKEGEKKAIESFMKELATEGKIVEKKLENIDKWTETNVKSTFKINTNSFANVSGNKIYLSPTLIFGAKQNLFREATRVYDINMGVPSEEIYNFVYTLPTGYKVEEGPKSAHLAFTNDDIVFDYIVDATTPNQLKINVKYKQKNIAFSADVYNDLKALFSNITTKMGEKVVLSKN